MIVCSCRNISDKDYPTQQALLDRLKQCDAKCCSCINNLQQEVFITKYSDTLIPILKRLADK